jgi:thiamine-phosphate pyrophosphorylase
LTLPRLHLVTDAAVLRGAGFGAVAERVLERCGAGVALQVRGHGLGGAELHAIAEPLAALALRDGAWLLINDRVDVALAVRAHGVQLGSRSLAVPDVRALMGDGARIGVSVHGVAEVVQAEADGADFVLLGNIHETASHPDRRALGLEVVTQSARSTTCPVIAIGGITVARVDAVARAGAAGVAVLSGVWSAAEPAAAAAEYLAAVNEAWRS